MAFVAKFNSLARYQLVRNRAEAERRVSKLGIYDLRLTFEGDSEGLEKKTNGSAPRVEQGGRR